jgi:hypothetical protein
VGARYPAGEEPVDERSGYTRQIKRQRNLAGVPLTSHPNRRAVDWFLVFMVDHKVERWDTAMKTPDFLYWRFIRPQ